MAKKINMAQLNDLFKDLLKEFELLKKNVGDQQTLISSKVENQLNSLNVKKDELSNFQNSQAERFNDLITQITQQQNEFDNQHQRLIAGENSIASQIGKLKDEIEEYHNSLLLGSEEESSIRLRISEVHKELNKYKREIFGYDEKDENDVVSHVPGLSDKINSLIINFEQKISEFDNSANDLLEEKEKEMNDLLLKMDLNYNAVEQETLSRKFFELSGIKNKSVFWANVLLVSSSIALTVALIYLFTSDSLRELFEDSNIIAGALIRVAITVPLIYLIVITSNRMKRESTIRDHYNFKGSIMSSYRNISTHIKNETIEISAGKQTELLEKVFDTVLENEADKIDKSDRFSIKQFSKMIGNIAKDLGTDKNTLISSLTDLFKDKVNKSPIP